VTGHEAKLQDP